MSSVPRETVSLGLPADTAYITVARLVVGGIGARIDLSYEALDEIQLATELLLVTLVKEDGAESLFLDVEWDDRELALVAGPASPDREGPGRAELEGLLSGLGVRLEAVDDSNGGPRLRAVRTIAPRVT
jgi:hypothetical protein